jgi:hypothetical protein
LAAKYNQLTPYQNAGNNPINDRDIDGMQGENTQTGGDTATTGGNDTASAPQSSGVEIDVNLLPKPQLIEIKADNMNASSYKDGAGRTGLIDNNASFSDDKTQVTASKSGGTYSNIKGVGLVSDSLMNGDYKSSSSWETQTSVINSKDFVGWGHNGIKNCFELAKKQLSIAGVEPVSSDKRIQMTTENQQTKKLEVSPTAQEGINAIIESLKQGKPIMVGVDYAFGRGINEGTTDHYIVIVGQGSDEKGNYFQFFDNATAHNSLGASSNNKFRLNTENNTLAGQFRNHNYTVSQVRPAK